ncbi:hypothetical protein LEP1GSC058_1032 [Leptospira fainei serovar Hurstbridge str. BUT 6]|uniref:Uncharacterized protein n=1 Tax=Leptospira fainei serovar Hurstbridge str. BUT 6 TaxID=1193011 RepID=S3UQ70_9LEPT|nr:hypothetical protein LEP1GSC058_1032 [Leptospira fainei serovar Hurstbridge str. BUT 6]
MVDPLERLFHTKQGNRSASPCRFGNTGKLLLYRSIFLKPVSIC